ncbi:hypothetical protein NESM_000175600 [Novymonas esmeraldas]|uniref:DUF2062 domain-containing protein n=1 Tax=Novymonas esmeraldas TaxID=1808958 RepID=A0AAW0F6Z8_9TRYP
MHLNRFVHGASQVLRERLLLPLRQLSWEEVLVAIAVGVLGGIFPVPLVTSLVTLAIGYYVRCSAAELVLGSTANFFCTPLQFALLPLLARFMGNVARVNVDAFTAAALRESLSAGYTTFLTSTGRMLCYATMGWFLFAIPAVVVLRFAQNGITRRQLHKTVSA